MDNTRSLPALFVLAKQKEAVRAFGKYLIDHAGKLPDGTHALTVADIADLTADFLEEMQGGDAMSINANLGHTKGRGTRAFQVYTVYNNKTDRVVIVDGEARECAKAMGVSLGTFYCTVCRARAGKIAKWHIESRYLDGKKRYTHWGKGN